MKRNYAKIGMRHAKKTGIRPETLVFEKLFTTFCPKLRYKMELPIGPYKLDFADLDNKIDYELESYLSPHDGKRQTLKDALRAEYLGKLGWKVEVVSEDTKQWRFLWKG